MPHFGGLHLGGLIVSSRPVLPKVASLSVAVQSCASACLVVCNSVRS
jgi:hypothetical protein